MPTGRDSYEHAIRTVADLVRGIEAELGSRATVGAGTPGALSPSTGRMRNSNLAHGDSSGVRGAAFLWD